VGCSNGTAFNVGLSQGLAPGATVASRRMRSAATPAHELAYQLFTSAARTTHGGNTVGTDTVLSSGTGIATPVLFSVHGRIPGTAGNQNAIPATDYTDTITVTITY
jgi:spore coat protein U-like protein